MIGYPQYGDMVARTVPLGCWVGRTRLGGVPSVIAEVTVPRPSGGIPLVLPSVWLSDVVKDDEEFLILLAAIVPYL